MNAGVLVVGLLAGAVLSLGPLTARNDAQSSLIQFSRTTFKSAAGEEIEAESGWLSVPESRKERDGARIRLPVVRFRSTSASPGSPLVYLAGGPGASGIESARQQIFPLLLALRDRGDVIIFDQRGTGRAEPSLSIPSKFGIPLNALLDSEAARLELANRAAESAKLIRSRGIDLSSYNTNESADDVNDLRIGLGAEKIVIWGHSYGSHLGLNILKRHGSTIERAILGGVNGPDQRWRAPRDLEDLIDRVDLRISDFPKLRRQIPSLKALIKQVLDEVEKKPATITLQGREVVVGRKELEVITALMAGDLEFVTSLPAFYGSMRDGDFTRAAQLTVSLIKERNVDTAMRYAMHIASGVSASRASLIESQQRGALFRNAINFPFDDPRFLAAWGIRDLGADYRTPVRSSVPTMFIGGDLDGRTSLSDLEEVSSHFRDASRLKVQGASHDFYHLTPKVLEAVLAFLGGKKPVQQIEVPLQLRGPDEMKLIREVRALILEKGVSAAATRLREVSSPSYASHVSSYVVGTVGFSLWQQDKRPGDAAEILKVGVEIFPRDAFLNERLGDVLVVLDRKSEAAERYRICLELNRLNRAALLKLNRLQ